MNESNLKAFNASDLQQIEVISSNSKRPYHWLDARWETESEPYTAREILPHDLTPTTTTDHVIAEYNKTRTALPS